MPPAVAVALGLVATACDGVALVFRGAEQLPVVGARLNRGRRAL